MTVTAPRGLRYLAVMLPAFRLERCGYEATDVAAVIDELKNAMRLVGLTPAARKAGLTEGMTAAAARALVPEVQIEPLDHAGEYADRCALVRAFDVLSDRVSFPWGDEILVEISCVSKVFGGEQNTLERACSLVGELGHLCRAAIADDPLAASALARHRDAGLIAGPGQAASLLAPLPLSALRPSDLLVDSLRAVGIESLGSFARLDPASVAGRFGDEGARLQQVARGLAPQQKTARWGDHRDGQAMVRARLGGASSTLQIQFALPGLLAELASILAERDQAVMRLTVLLRLEGGWGDAGQVVDSTLARQVRIGVRVGRPTRNPVVLQTLIEQRITGLELAAPIEELVLEVSDAVADIGWQPGLTDRTEASEPLPDLLARLADHLGQDACCAAELVDAWRPEVAWKKREWPPRSPHPHLPLALTPGDVPHGAQSDDPVEVLEAWEQALLRPRPSLLLPEPAPLQVRCQGQRPTAIHLADGGWARVDHAEGPERLSGEWWAPERAWSRDYWVVEADGRIAWIFCDHNRDRWALHGWF
jgi:protein ImuB